MASASGSEFSFRKQSVACGTFGYRAPRMWECDVCLDYVLCEDCYQGPLEGCAALSAPPQVHNQDHRMSPHVTTFTCVGCDSTPIWKQRWRCKVCSDFDLCEACYGELEAVDMPPEHSKEHPMVAVKVCCAESSVQKLQSSFSKPVSPQWSYQVDGDEPMAGFIWGKRKPLADLFNASLMSSVEYETVKQISPMTNEDYIPNPEDL